MNGRKFDAWDYLYRSDRTGDRFDGNKTEEIPPALSAG